MSDNLDEAKLFYIDIEGKRPVKVDVSFRDFHHHNIAYHCGTPITLTGTGKDHGGQLEITKVKELKSLFGKKPGSAPG